MVEIDAADEIDYEALSPNAGLGVSIFFENFPTSVRDVEADVVDFGR